MQQPNDFAKTAKSFSHKGNLNETQTCRLEFWTKLNEEIDRRGKPFNKHKASPDHWYTVAVGSSQCYISIDLVNKEHKIRVGLWIADNKELFDTFSDHKDEIEKAVGRPLDWDRLEGKKASVISTDIPGLYFSKQDNYPQLMEEIIEKVLLFRKAFTQYIYAPCDNEERIAMMGKTHLTMGMAASLATSFFVLQPRNLSDTLIALAGGAVGGVLADVDTVDNDYHCDALIGQLLGALALGAVLAYDYFYKLGVYDYVMNSNKILSIIAGIVFFVLYIIGFRSEHRTFTHSMMAMALFSGCFTIVYPRLGFAVFVGYASHLVLDLLNKKDVPLLFPLKKGICFRLCYAGKTANKVFMFVGLVTTLVLAGYRIYPFVIH